MTPHSTRPRRHFVVALSAAALLLAGGAAAVAADSGASSSRTEVSRGSGSSGGGGSSSSGSSSRSGVSSRGSSSSSQSGGGVRSRSSSTSSSSRSPGRAVVTRPSHGRVPPRWNGSHYYHGHYPYYDFRFGYFGYYPYWYWGYPYYGYGGYYPPVVYASTPGYGMGALDLNVRPKQTEVYVNGQYVGLVKQYDGFPGYLWLESGVYQIAFYRPGHETVFRELEIFTGMVLDVAVDMVPGEAVLPQRAEQGVAVPDASGRDPRDMTIPGQRAPLPYEAPREESRAPATAETVPGRVDLSVEPGEASVYLDGRFVGTGRELSGGLPVASGEHVVEVVLPGYEQETVRFTVTPGAEAAVDVRLEPLGSAGGG